jgi:hypothetical protein
MPTAQDPPGSPRTTDPPPDLEASGLALWQGYTAGRAALGPGERVLLHDACRITDRLDRLAALIGGEAEVWELVEIPYSEDGRPLRLEVNGALAESRLQSSVLRLNLTALDAVRAAWPSGTQGPASQPDDPGDPVDEIGRRRAHRRTGTPGQ